MENAQKIILERISEPGYSRVFQKLLQFCDVPRTRTAIETEVASYTEMQIPLHTPLMIIGWLEQVGALERVAVREEVAWQTTEAAKVVLQVLAPESRLPDLLSQEPYHTKIYLRILEFCHTPRSRAEIEETLALDLSGLGEQFFASHFIQTLEVVGALEWGEKKWQTTRVGKQVSRGRE